MKNKYFWPCINVFFFLLTIGFLIIGSTYHSEFLTVANFEGGILFLVCFNFFGHTNVMEHKHHKKCHLIPPILPPKSKILRHKNKISADQSSITSKDCWSLFFSFCWMFTKSQIGSIPDWFCMPISNTIGWVLFISYLSCHWSVE